MRQLFPAASDSKPVSRAWRAPVRRDPARPPHAVRRPGASPSYEATGSSSGTPMIERILIIRRDSTRETCIWLVPIFSAISA